MVSDERLSGSADLTTYVDPKNRFSFDYPKEWMKLNVNVSYGDGVALLPVPTDNLTCLSAEAVSLGVKVTGTDLKTLREGFVIGLDNLVASKLDSVQVLLEDNVIALAGHQTYSDGWGHRERFVWLLYRGNYMVRVLAQGSSSEEFKRWAPLFAETFKSAMLAKKPAPGAGWLADFVERGPIDQPDDPRRFYLDPKYDKGS